MHKSTYNIKQIMTSHQTGGLSQGYKPQLPASAFRRWLSLCSRLIALDSSLASQKDLGITYHYP